MSERTFRRDANGDLVTKQPGPVAQLIMRGRTRFQALGSMMMLAVLGVFQFHAPLASVSLTDFTQIWAWLLVGGVLVLVFGLIGAYLATGVGPRKVIAVGGIAATLILVAIAGAWFSSPVSASTGGAINTSGLYTFSVSLPSSGYPAGQTLNLAPLSITADVVGNTSTAAGALCLQNGAGASHACAATAHNYIVVPVKISRTDNFNYTAGATVCISGLPLLTNASTGIQYGPVGYVTQTSSSPGIWKVQWSSGSIGGANPTQPAPQTTSNVACNLVGVPAFGSATPVLSLSLGGSNSTSANWAYLATQYSSYPVTVTISGGAGSTPASFPINIVFTGNKNA